MAFGREPAIASVDISPDGKHIVAVVSPDGRSRHIAIWSADDLSQPPYNVGTDPKAEITSVRFIKNDRIFARVQQLDDTATADRPRYTGRTMLLDLKGDPVATRLRFDGLDSQQQARVGVGQLVSSLPQDPQSIMVLNPRNGDVYKLNLYSGSFERINRGSERFGVGGTDLNGEIRERENFEFDNGAVYIGTWLKHPDTGRFEEHFRSYARDRQPVSVVSYTNDPNVVLVSANRDGADRSAIYEYKIREKQWGEIAFSHPLFEATGAIRSTAPSDFGEILGFTYGGERSQTYWADPSLEAAQASLRQALNVDTVPVVWTDIASGNRSRFQVGDGADVSISAWSDDRTRFIISKSGNSTPPEYYVLMNGRLRLLGRAYPELANAPLGKGSLIQYKARDGLIIPAILTKPDPTFYGPGPYPTIITPHGGPWSRDDLGWDTTGWNQYFAARGYAVLQPQFRGSQGWGERLWRAGDREWGRKMQDDNDDGALYLIAEGIADRNRIAIHGYSYGGYAAMMGAVRPNGIYQCAAAGAGPSTIDLFKKGTYGSRFLREFQHPTADGEDPLRRANEVSIPVYLYTGDHDSNVMPSESRAFAAALERAGKKVDLRILPDMDHTLNTWTPDNFANILTSVEDFFKTDCKLGGL
jgi:dipeptidyl aminopeptidase/acylaminoacyl peptidase